MSRYAQVLAATVLATMIAATGSAWAASPVVPDPGSTWTDPAQGTVADGIPHSR